MATTLSINFYKKNITEELRNEFHLAISYENADMNIQLLDTDISRLETRITNLKNNENKTEEEKAIELADLTAKLEEKQESKSEFEQEKTNLDEVYNKVVSVMSEKNADNFGNSKDVVRTVLRVLATWNNSKLVKYAIIPAFKDETLYNALETIHITSKAGDDGNLIMSKEVKEAYKTASAQLENIIKKTFSLPFETPYTDKTRVKLTAEDKKLLNDCYIKGFSNKFDVDDEKGTVSFKKRQINTLVKAKKNRKTGKMEYDYSGLASTIANIIIKHYFA
mgnify:CR=1 FL=1